MFFYWRYFIRDNYCKYLGINPWDVPFITFVYEAFCV